VEQSCFAMARLRLSDDGQRFRPALVASGLICVAQAFKEPDLKRYDGVTAKEEASSDCRPGTGGTSFSLASQLIFSVGKRSAKVARFQIPKFSYRTAKVCWKPRKAASTMRKDGSSAVFGEHCSGQFVPAAV
jgi:hypothetical protein